MIAKRRFRIHLISREIQVFRAIESASVFLVFYLLGRRLIQQQPVLLVGQPIARSVNARKKRCHQLHKYSVDQVLGKMHIYVIGDNASSEHSPSGQLDRKSTRLNSSHVSISYAVFCLKKKKK